MRVMDSASRVLRRRNDRHCGTVGHCAVGHCDLGRRRDKLTPLPPRPGLCSGPLPPKPCRGPLVDVPLPHAPPRDALPRDSVVHRSSTIATFADRSRPGRPQLGSRRPGTASRAGICRARITTRYVYVTPGFTAGTIARNALAGCGRSRFSRRAQSSRRPFRGRANPCAAPSGGPQPEPRRNRWRLIWDTDIPPAQPASAVGGRSDLASSLTTR